MENTPREMICRNTNQEQEKMKEADPPHRPMVHSELPSSPQQTQSQNDLRRRQLQQNDEEDETMAEKTKKSTMAAQINTSWNKKWWKASWSLPLSTGHGGFHHKVVHGSTSWNKKW